MYMDDFRGLPADINDRNNRHDQDGNQAAIETQLAADNGTNSRAKAEPNVPGALGAESQNQIQHRRKRCSDRTKSSV